MGDLSVGLGGNNIQSGEHSIDGEVWIEAGGLGREREKKQLVGEPYHPYNAKNKLHQRRVTLGALKKNL